MLIKKTLLGYLFPALIGFLLPFHYLTKSSYAQIGVSPLVIQEQTQRGQAQGIINVRNTTNEAIRVRVYTEPFIYEREKGFQSIEISEADLTPYLRFSPTEMTIPAGAERRVRFVAQFPPSLPDREYRAAIFSETLQQSQDNQQNSVAIIARIGVTVYVRKGNLQPNFNVDSASYNPQENLVGLLVKNIGEATALPKVIWQLNQNGSSIVTGESAETTVMAQSDRIINLNLVKLNETTQKEEKINLKKGEYQLTGQLVWQEGNNNPTIIPFQTKISVDN